MEQETTGDEILILGENVDYPFELNVGYNCYITNDNELIIEELI